MPSPFSSLFLAIQDRIAAQVPDIKHIDQQLRQIDMYPERPPVSFPCALIDVGQFRTTDLSDNVQTLVGSVVIQLTFAPFSASSSITPQNYKEMAVSYYDLENQLYIALQGWQPEGFGALNRVAMSPIRGDIHYRQREIMFDIQFEDYSAQPQRTTIRLGDIPMDVNIDTP